MDQHSNFAYSTVLTPPSPAASGTSVVIQTGDGAAFPTPPFNATVWPSSGLPLRSNAEIVRCTGKSADTLTIARAQEGSNARSVIAGDQIAATITNKVVTDIEAAVVKWLSDWSAGTSYNVGDIVAYAGVDYIAGKPNVGSTPPAVPSSIAAVTYGTTPPTSPRNGDLWFFPADTTNGIVWQFRYNSGSASAYKWEFIGGAAASANIPTDEATVAGYTVQTWTDLATVGPSVVVPRAGDYSVQWTAGGYNNGAAAEIHAGAAIAAGAPGLFAAVTTPGPNYWADLSGMSPARAPFLGLPASSEIRLRYWSGVAGASNHFAQRALSVLPVRVS